MGFNNRPRQPQSDAKTFDFGSGKWREFFRQQSRGEAWAGIAHAQLNDPTFDLSRLDGDLSLFGAYLVHRLDCIAHEIENDPLDLENVDFNWWQIVLQNNTASYSVALQLGLTLIENIIEDAFNGRRCLLDLV
jgi:hypothetical protein